MVRYSFTFLIMFIIGLLVSVSEQAATSVVPGWHTTIFSPWFIISTVQLLWLGIASVIYFILEQKALLVNRTIFYIHAILSLSFFADGGIAHFENDTNVLVFAIIPFLLFCIGQAIFIIGIVKAKKSTNL